VEGNQKEERVKNLSFKYCRVVWCNARAVSVFGLADLRGQGRAGVCVEKERGREEGLGVGG